MSIMFANTRTPGASSGHLVEFKAGRTLLEAGSTPDKRKAVADKTKGTIFIKQSSDQLMHFCWKNREKGAVDLFKCGCFQDLIIFPGETEFLRIKECNDGRVYMLKFKSGDDHKLFWLQEPNTDKDDEYAKKVNDLLNNPPSSRSRAGGSERTSNVNSLAALNSALIAGNDDIGALGNMDQNQIMQLFSLMNAGNADILPQLGLAGNSGSSESVETPMNRKERSEPVSSAAGSSSKFDSAMLSQIISALPSTSDGSTLKKQRQVELRKVLSRANIEDTVKANSDVLTPHLPPTGEPDELAKTISSPQFQQAADFFGSALSSGQLGPALTHFNLDKKVISAADKGDLLHFCNELTNSQKDPKAIDAQIKADAEKEENAEKAAKKEPKKDDDQMDLD
ncbi:Proteasomal ubiquitin receptor ADRM1-like protein [Aphelenchoides bicaudatus]|nr:Proteasomal ubiquitin receptor ADRM1-like protein [Aphelenchoides bicaudatus]